MIQSGALKPLEVPTPSVEMESEPTGTESNPRLSASYLEAHLARFANPPKKRRVEPWMEGEFSSRLIKLKERDMEMPDCNVIKYFQKVQKTDAEMASVAAVILGLPVTQVSVERAFSYLPLVITPRRDSLKSSTVDDIIVIKLNEFKNKQLD